MFAGKHEGSQVKELKHKNVFPLEKVTFKLKLSRIVMVFGDVRREEKILDRW